MMSKQEATPKKDPFLYALLQTKSIDSHLNLTNLRKNHKTPKAWLNYCLRIFANLPETTTSINFSNNQIGQWDLVDLQKFLNAIPTWVVFINLETNQLFANKPLKEKDALREVLNLVAVKKTVVLTNNGDTESDLTRAILPMLSWTRQRLPKEIAFKILADLKPEVDISTRIPEVMQRLTTESASISTSLVDKAYRRYGGSILESATLFFTPNAQKITKLKEWAQQNNEASTQTLIHYGL